jgi:small-conductance mechanosensitive channel
VATNPALRRHLPAFRTFGRLATRRRLCLDPAAMELLDRIYYGNSVKTWLIAGGIVLAVVVGARIIRGVVALRLRRFAGKTETRLDDLLLEVLGHTRMVPILVLALYVGSLSLTLDPRIHYYLPMIAIAALIAQLGIWGSAALRSWIDDYRKRKIEGGDTAGLGTVSVVSIIVRMVLWVIVTLLLLDNFGVDVTALVAGLGIGGVAIALALQTVLSDIFASVAITLDKPFEVGDFIIVGDLLGNVEHVGIKTTRVRSLSGEQLVFGNHDLLGSRIRNYKRMNERRIVFKLGVVYQTPRAQVERIPGILREAVEAQDGVRFDRAHFFAYGDFSLVFEVVYWVLVPDYVIYMDLQQAINLHIMQRFEAEGIQFAYPTQTIHLSRGAA